ncbi:hypothetical protein KO566_01005 [Flavobacteriaceae bacterium XHP0103]|uniref:hypothetical protein n=1 Tax=Marixanthotalea marina TaxID=2844359 RepID=UPI002989A85F|nr:hypothetical protein [Marixanthotalea marina]MBU3820622.1 hypothetical protein [Marixanthotalea marina]
METLKKNILGEIASLTRTIEDKYPELQKYLDERRNTLDQGNTNSGELNNEELSTYRDSLKDLIEKYNNKKA